ncbi:MAG TPA: hypothetical protein VHL57_10980, partial [Flavobacteriales bacterium]|nr:hypothetical protein [Flavobacteriales bacterium]
MTPGAYVYTVTGTAPCANDQATVTVSETSTPDAGGDGTLTVCADGVPVGLFAQLTGADGGGTWTDPDGVAHSATLTPGTDMAGVYTYTIAAVPPCSGDAATVTVTINTAPEAGDDASLSMCDQAAAVALINSLPDADAGGTWSGPSPVVGGNYDPTTMTPGAYVYTVTGAAPCGNDQATVTVSETSAPNAGADAEITVCSSGVPFNMFDLLVGAETGGIWTDAANNLHSVTFTPGGDDAGVYTYTIAGTPPCSGDAATVTVTIEQLPDAGQDGSTAVCTGDAPFDLLTVLDGTPDTGGAWTDPDGAAVSNTFDPAASAQGIYTYTVGGPACPQVTSTVTVTVAPGPNAGQDASLPLCAEGPVVDLFDELGGTPDASGVWTGPDGSPADPLLDPSLGASGDYTYTVTGNATCPDAQAVVSVSVSQPPNAGSIGIATLCSDGVAVSLFDQLGGTPDAGGTWTDPSNAAFDGTFDPAVDVQGVYTYTVAGVAPCPSASASITVEVQVAPDAGADAAHAFCSSEAIAALLPLLGGTPGAGGTWIGPDGSEVSGTFDPASSAAGLYRYVLEAIAPCVNDTASLTIDVSQTADAGDDGSINLCSDAASVQLFTLLGGTPDTGGAWTAPDGSTHSGELQPSTLVSGDYTYTVTADAPCPQDVALVHVTILAAPQAEITALEHGGCAPVEVQFASTYAGGGNCTWDLGDGTLLHDCTPPLVTY